MGRTEWRWNGALPLTFFTIILVLGVVAAVLSAELRARVNWPLVGFGIVALAGALTLAAGFLFPMGMAIGDDGVRLSYLHRREFVGWSFILRLEYHVDSSVTIETSHRSIHLGIPGKAFVAPLVREMRKRKVRIRTPMPEEYPELGYSF